MWTQGGKYIDEQKQRNIYVCRERFGDGTEAVTTERKKKKKKIQREGGTSRGCPDGGDALARGWKINPYDANGGWVG